MSCVHLYTSSVVLCTLMNTIKLLKNIYRKGAHLNTNNNDSVHSDCLWCTPDRSCSQVRRRSASASRLHRRMLITLLAKYCVSFVHTCKLWVLEHRLQSRKKQSLVHHEVLIPVQRLVEIRAYNSARGIRLSYSL